MCLNFISTLIRKIHTTVTTNTVYKEYTEISITSDDLKDMNFYTDKSRSRVVPVMEEP